LLSGRADNGVMGHRLRALELFAGIGGFAIAAAEKMEIAAAVDIRREALDVYRANFSHPTVVRTLESAPASVLRDWNADVWWMSPPCQPYTSRGKQRDLEDPRSLALLHLTKCIAEVRPAYVALENVPAFLGSQAHKQLQAVFADRGYVVREAILCPTQFGLPNQRRRFYLIAGRQSLGPWPPILIEPRPLAEFLEPCPKDAIWLSEERLRQLAGQIHIVRADDPLAVTHCFTSAYGRSPRQAGSYLEVQGRVRLFTPREILNLLGFPASHRLPAEKTPTSTWPLVGNSLAIPVVRHVLRAIEGEKPGSQQSEGGGPG
jgi:site-specific DNA-cytosine methylase